MGGVVSVFQNPGYEVVGASRVGERDLFYGNTQDGRTIAVSVPSMPPPQSPDEEMLLANNGGIGSMRYELGERRQHRPWSAANEHRVDSSVTFQLQMQHLRDKISNNIQMLRVEESALLDQYARKESELSAMKDSDSFRAAISEVKLAREKGSGMPPHRAILIKRSLDHCTVEMQQLLSKLHSIKKALDKMRKFSHYLMMFCQTNRDGMRMLSVVKSWRGVLETMMSERRPDQQQMLDEDLGCIDEAAVPGSLRHEMDELSRAIDYMTRYQNDLESNLGSHIGALGIEQSTHIDAVDEFMAMMNNFGESSPPVAAVEKAATVSDPLPVAVKVVSASANEVSRDSAAVPITADVNENIHASVVEPTIASTVRYVPNLSSTVVVQETATTRNDIGNVLVPS